MENASILSRTDIRILGGTDAQSIADLLKKEGKFDNIYNFICKRFEYIPLKLNILVR